MSSGKWRPFCVGPSELLYSVWSRFSVSWSRPFMRHVPTGCCANQTRATRINQLIIADNASYLGRQRKDYLECPIEISPWHQAKIKSLERIDIYNKAMAEIRLTSELWNGSKSCYCLNQRFLWNIEIPAWTLPCAKVLPTGHGKPKTNDPTSNIYAKWALIFFFNNWRGTH